jgi:putative addiction module killer protein
MRRPQHKVAAALYRLEQGNFSNARRLGRGISEYKIAFGPGYRIYFGREGDDRVVLLGGGTRKRQSLDIQRSRERWSRYQSSKS